MAEHEGLKGLPATIMLNKFIKKGDASDNLMGDRMKRIQLSEVSSLLSPSLCNFTLSHPKLLKSQRGGGALGSVGLFIRKTFF